MLKKTTRGMTAGMTRRGVGFAVAGGGGPTYLLDTYSGAAAAYSLRRLNTAYTGPVVQVRRSGDSAEDTFSAAEVGDGTLAAWVTAGGGTEDGFVKTWYDQSGNGNDASQATAANQPQIVASGAVVLENGKPTLEFNGTSYALATSSINLTSTAQVSLIAVTSWDGPNTNAGMVAEFSQNWNFNAGSVYILTGTTGSGTGNGFQTGSRGTSSPNANQVAITSTIAPTQQVLLFATHDIPGDLSSIFGNGASGTNATGDKGLGNFGNYPIYLASRSGTSVYYDGKIQEFVLFPVDETSNRTGIESNIASHYGITLS